MMKMTVFYNIKYYISRYFIHILIIFCSFSVIYKSYILLSAKTNIVTIVKQTKLSTFNSFGLGPYNTVNVSVEDSYNELIDVANFSFTINPEPCKNYNAGLLLLIIVSSNPSRFENRQVIRSTWGRNLESTKVVFLFGETKKKDLSSRIKSESLKYGDIVQGNFIDAYKNMTYKHVMGLKWVAHHCPTAKYILKTDDDVVINSHQLRHFLAKELSPWGAKDLIACHVSKKRKPQRKKKLKWNVSKKEFPGEYYPTYCPGWAILYSQDVVRKLLKIAQVTPYFWIDDVHITGVCAEKIGVPRTSFYKLMLLNSKVKKLETQNSIFFQPYIFGPIQQSPDGMKRIWNLIVQSYY